MRISSTYGLTFVLSKTQLRLGRLAVVSAFGGYVARPSRLHGDWDMQINASRATATPLDRVVEPLFSDGTHRVTIYDYHVYAVDLGGLPNPASLHPDFRYFTIDELLAAPNVTSSTGAIARALVENRNVALAVVTREAPRGREFLLVSNRTALSDI